MRKKHRIRNFRASVRFKMMAIFIIAITIPSVTIAVFVPDYYNNNLTKNVEVLTQSTADSVLKNLNAYVDDLERLVIVPYLNDSIMNAFYTYGKIYGGQNVPILEQLNASKALKETFPNYTQNIRKDITGTLVCLIPKGVFSVYINNSPLVENYPFQQQEWYKQAVAANGKTIFVSAHKQNYLIHPAADKVFSIVKLVKDPYTMEPIAVVKADADMHVLSSILDNIKLNVNSIISIIDENGNTIYSTTPLTGAMQAAIQSGKTQVTNGGEVFSLHSKNINKTNWRMVTLISKSELTRNMQQMQLTVIGVYIFVLLLSLLLLAYLSKWLVSPLHHIVDVMGEVEKGNFDVRVKVKGRDELSSLGSAFNIMLDQLKNLLIREYKAVMSKQTAEYLALQSQIRPHFLYNTLNSMMGINRLGDRDLLEKTIISLTGMLRYMTEQADFTTLREEFQMLQQYCYLQKMRFQSRLSYKIDLQKEAENVKIPKLIIQPLVENAIVHGIEPLGETGKLLVCAKIELHNEKRTVVIDVCDSGVGFICRDGQTPDGVGLKNVQDRVKYAYPRGDVHIESAVGKGTQITISFPMEGNI